MTKHTDHTAAAICDAVASARREHTEIAQLCYLAGRSEMAADLIRDGISLDAVRRRLASLAVAEPVRRPTGGGNGSAFDVLAIETMLAAKPAAPQ